MDDAELKLLLADKKEHTISDAPADVIPPATKNDVTLDEDRLSNHLSTTLSNDIFDRDQMNWTEKREYDLRSYHAVKDDYLSHVPWEGASNSPEMITPVMVDVGTDAVMGSIADDIMNMTVCTGIGEEDIKNSKKVQKIHNWVVGTDEEDFYQEFDGNIHQSFKHGTSYFKEIVDIGDGIFRICPYTIPIERILLPIDARSPLKKDSDHVHQIIPLTANQLLQRKAAKKYRNLEYVDKGWTLKRNLTESQLASIKQMVTGLDINRKIVRDTFFIIESYISYYEKNSLTELELIVWWAPSSGKILRIQPNPDGIRPFADYFIYENHGYAYHFSLPEKIRTIQEDANYTKKQVTDAGDIAINPPTFYEEGTNFDPNIALNVPSGMYPMKNAASITQRAPVQLSAMMERHKHIQEYWNAAERVTGLTDVFQGMPSYSPRMTATSDMLRQKHMDLRFNKLLKKINQGWKKSCNLRHYYIDKFMPRSEKVRILGSDSFSTIEQLFPLPENSGQQSAYGLQIGGRFDFNFAGKSKTDIELDNRNKAMMADAILADPNYMQDKGVRWKAYKAKADALDFRELEDILPEPKEARVLSPNQVINEIMSGNIDVMPDPSDPNLDVSGYEIAIKFFMRSENFKQADPQKKQMFSRFLLLLEMIRIGQMKAWQDHQVVSGVKIQLANQGGMQPQIPGMPPQTMPPAPTQGNPQVILPQAAMRQ